MGDYKAIRKGRFSDLPSWQKQYRKMLTTPEQAAAVVRDGDVIATTGGATVPQGVTAAIARRARAEGFKHLEWSIVFHLQQHEFTKPEYSDIFEINTIFTGYERNLFGQGNIHYMVNHLSQTGKIVESRKPRIVAISCSPPDRDGWMSRSIWGSHISREVYQNPECGEVIVTVNTQLPYLHGATDRHMMIHVSEVDYIVEEDFNMVEIHTKESTEAERAIAGYIADMIHDGSCLQFGQGGLADAIGKNLVYARKKDLGLHSEVVSNCIVDLMEAGVINNSKKSLHRGKTVGSAVVGNRSLWEYCNYNDAMRFMEIDYVNDMDIIRQNDNVVSVNNAMELDLTGQVCSESIGYRQYTGTGGQLEWVIASQQSKGGKSIIAINSVYKDKQGNLQSKIKPVLSPGAIVTTPRTFVQYVVTEYGVADLKYRSVKERAEALIGIAHPDFRQELREEAGKLNMI